MGFLAVVRPGLIPMLHIALCILYFAVLLALSCYGLHRLHLVILCRRHQNVIDDAMFAAIVLMVIVTTLAAPPWLKALVGNRAAAR